MDEARQRRVAVKLRELFGIDVRSLAALRIGIALMILVDLCDRGRFIAAYYTDAGFMPREIVPQVDPLVLSYHMLGGSFAWQALLFALAAGAAAMLLVGYRTRLAAVVSWLLLVSLQNRNYFVNYGGDLEMERVLFWCLFLPLGACWSLDARREGAVGPVRQRAVSIASAAVLLQVAYVYLFSGLAKAGDAWLVDHTAIYLALHNEFLVTGIGPWFRQFDGVMAALTPLVVWFERGAILLLFCPIGTAPVRFAMVVAIWGFHFGLASMINLATFPLMCGVCAFAYLPTAFWDRVGGVSGAKSEPAVVAGPGRPARAFIALALIYTTALLTAEIRGGRLPPAIREVGHLLQLDQSWVLYAPEPSPFDVRRIASGVLDDGTPVPELIAAGRGERWETVQALHDAKRFQVYQEHWIDPRFQEQVDVYGHWLCREWNAAAGTPAGADRALAHVRWDVYARRILPAGAKGPETVELLFDLPCDPQGRAADSS